MPLTMARPNEKVLVKEMAGGLSSRMRLSDMGLRKGDVIEVINNTGQGRIIIGRECTRLAVGRGIAQKIIVSAVDEDAGPVCEPAS